MNTNINLARAVAQHILDYPFKLWGYGEGVALEALLLAADALAEPQYQDFVAGLMRQWLAARADVPYTDHVAPGKALVMLYERTGEIALLDRARALADFFAGLTRASNGGRLHRPDHPEFHSYVYVDCMDFDAPFLSALGQVTGERAYHDLAADCLLGHAAALFDPAAGLFYHLYDAGQDRVNGAFWGRGNGWAALGMVETLAQLPAGHPARGAIAGLLRQQMASLVALQTAEGEWHTVLDRPDTYREGSLPAMFYVALTLGMRLGVLPTSYQGAADRAWDALSRRLAPDGLLRSVSAASPPGSAEGYAAIVTGGAFPWGQGPALHALLLRNRG